MRFNCALQGLLVNTGSLQRIDSRVSVTHRHHNLRVHATRGAIEAGCSGDGRSDPSAQAPAPMMLTSMAVTPKHGFPQSASTFSACIGIASSTNVSENRADPVSTVGDQNPIDSNPGRAEVVFERDDRTRFHGACPETECTEFTDDGPEPNSISCCRTRARRPDSPAWKSRDQPDPDRQATGVAHIAQRFLRQPRAWHPP